LRLRSAATGAAAQSDYVVLLRAGRTSVLGGALEDLRQAVPPHEGGEAHLLLANFASNSSFSARRRLLAYLLPREPLLEAADLALESPEPRRSRG
jgi:hypothetical protein